jgi:hypothetical protein
MRAIILITLFILFSVTGYTDQIGTNNLPKNFRIYCASQAEPRKVDFQFVWFVTQTSEGDYIQNESVGLYHSLLNVPHTEWRSDHLVVNPLYKQIEPENPTGRGGTNIFFTFFDSFASEEKRPEYRVGVHFPTQLRSIGESTQFEAHMDIQLNGSPVYATNLQCIRYR